MSFQILWRVNPPEKTHTHIVKLNVQIKQVDLNITPAGSLADYLFLLSPQLIRFLLLSPLLEVWPFLHYNFPLSQIISGRHPCCKADLAMCCIIRKIKTSTLELPGSCFRQPFTDFLNSQDISDIDEYTAGPVELPQGYDEPDQLAQYDDPLGPQAVIAESDNYLVDASEEECKKVGGD